MCFVSVGDHQFLWYITGIPGGSSDFRSIWTVRPASTFGFLAYSGTGESTLAYFTVQDFLDGYCRLRELKERLLAGYSASNKKNQVNLKIQAKMDKLIWSMFGAFRHKLVFQEIEYKWKDVLIFPPVMHNMGHLAINIIQVVVQKYSWCTPLKKIVGALMNSQNVVKVHGTFAKARAKLSNVAEYMHENPGFDDFDCKVVELSSTLCHIVYCVSQADRCYSLQLWIYSFLSWIFFCLNPVMIDKKKTCMGDSVYIQVLLRHSLLGIYKYVSLYYFSRILLRSSLFLLLDSVSRFPGHSRSASSSPSIRT